MHESEKPAILQYLYASVDVTSIPPSLRERRRYQRHVVAIVTNIPHSLPVRRCPNTTGCISACRCRQRCRDIEPRHCEDIHHSFYLIGFRYTHNFPIWIFNASLHNVKNVLSASGEFVGPNALNFFNILSHYHFFFFIDYCTIFSYCSTTT